jgi:putative transposase
MRYRRARVAGGTYFFGVVTHGRRPIFADGAHVDSLRVVFRRVMARHPFTVDAFVLLPDHLHCLWTLPVGDNDFPLRWNLIKSGFSRMAGRIDGERPNPSRVAKRERGIWQRRYWEHMIRDDRDYAAHCDYIHYNPVKHALCATPEDWPWSTFHRFVREGSYPTNWGVGPVVFDEGIGGE